MRVARPLPLVSGGPDGTALIIGKPALSETGKRSLITITASNHIGHAATKKVTIRIR